MAGTWIKVRVDLPRDPKVLMMANELGASPEFVHWMLPSTRAPVAPPEAPPERHQVVVSRHAIVNSVIAALIQIWHVANEQGVSDGDDLALEFASPATLDEIAGVPGIGNALLSVGWLYHRPSQSGRPAVIFPNFLKYNVPEDERGKRKKQDRQRRYKDRKRRESQATDNAPPSASDPSPGGASQASPVAPPGGATGASTIEKRREENIGTPSEYRSGAPPAKRKRSSPTGPHAEFVKVFCESWEAKYKIPYPFDGGKDGSLIAALRQHLDEDVGRFREVVKRYLADTERFVAEKNHPLGILKLQLPKYLVAPKTGGLFDAHGTGDVGSATRVGAREGKYAGRNDFPPDPKAAAADNPQPPVVAEPAKDVRPTAAPDPGRHP